ncbi:MAG: hypothetical protein WDN25_13200 [Acetobacteraceae bacterium]
MSAPNIITTTDHAALADALFGGPAATRAALRVARVQLSLAEQRLAEHDADTAAGVPTWIAGDRIALAVWRASRDGRARLVASVERWRAEIARCEARLAGPDSAICERCGETRESMREAGPCRDPLCGLDGSAAA